MEELQQILARRVKTLRKSAGMTQEQLSERVDIAPQYLSRLETARRVPSMDTLVDLADALNTTASALLAEPQTDVQAERSARVATAMAGLAEEDAALLETHLVALAARLKARGGR